MSYSRKLVLILFVTILFSSRAYGYTLSNITAQPSSTSEIIQPEGNLSGYITDSFMNPIDAALVRVYFHETYEENYSDSLGYYHVAHIPLCYCLKNATCSKQGYYPEWVMLSIGENTTYDFILTSLNQSCYPVFNGTMGTNGWYVSCVDVTFVIDEDIEAVFYKVDAGAWNQYDEPVQICTDGMHIFYWYYTYNGNLSDVLQTTLNIDCAIPELTLLSERLGIGKIKIIAEAADETSEINRVEFYVDGVLSYIDATEPYEGIMTGIGSHHVEAIVFDNAGNAANSTIVTAYSYQSHLQYLRIFFSRLFFVR
jgi:hypothetical protein